MWRDRMEKNIQSLKIREKGRISRIDGPSLRERMEKMGVREGAPVERLGLPSLSGCVEIKIDRRKVTLGLGVALKVKVDQHSRSVGLMDMSPGDRGTISAIQGGQRITEILQRNFGITTGTAIQMVGQKPDRDFLVEVRGKRASLCEGDASKIVVKKSRKTQLNYLKAGDAARIVAIAAGLRASSMLKEFGIEEGRTIRLVQITESDFREPEAPILIRVDDQELSLGYGMAEKIWVEEVGETEE